MKTEQYQNFEQPRQFPPEQVMSPDKELADHKLDNRNHIQFFLVRRLVVSPENLGSEDAVSDEQLAEVIDPAVLDSWIKDNSRNFDLYLQEKPETLLDFDINCKKTLDDVEEALRRMRDMRMVS